MLPPPLGMAITTVNDTACRAPAEHAARCVRLKDGMYLEATMKKLIRVLSVGGVVLALWGAPAAHAAKP